MLDGWRARHDSRVESPPARRGVGVAQPAPEEPGWEVHGEETLRLRHAAAIAMLLVAGTTTAFALPALMGSGVAEQEAQSSTVQAAPSNGATSAPGSSSAATAAASNRDDHPRCGPGGGFCAGALPVGACRSHRPQVQEAGSRKGAAASTRERLWGQSPAARRRSHPRTPLFAPRSTALR